MHVTTFDAIATLPAAPTEGAWEVPVDFQIDRENQFVTVTMQGVVVLQEILDYFDALVVEDAMRYPKLIDTRQADPQLSDDDVMVLGARVSAYAAYDPRGPIAAVVAGRQTTEFLRRFMNLGGADRPMQIFTTVDEARTWLKAAVRVEVKRGGGASTNPGADGSGQR
jgi:hypothetical protein